MKLFYEGSLRAVFESQRVQMKSEIEAQDPNYLLNANETQLFAHFTDKYRIESITLHEENVYASDREEIIPAEHFDSFSFNVKPGNSYRKQVVRFHLPFSGEKDLLKYMPSSGIPWTEDVLLENREICFDVIAMTDEPAMIRKAWENFLKCLKTQMESSAKEVNAFNAQLEGEVVQIVQQRKDELLKKNNLLGSLGVPLKKALDIPSTFAVSAPKRRVIVSKPVASTTPFLPEPTLDEKTYNEILKIIHDTGIEIERHPSIYVGKDEETLRDHLLMVLSPHFQSVSGETFNKTGKTDILIRHEGKNLFVAECAIWKGIKQCLGKIDQLLSYLTWRDSKTALILFVRNKDFSSILNTIQEEMPTHKCFVQDIGVKEEGWFQFVFHLPDDESRTVQLVVLAYHFP